MGDIERAIEVFARGFAFTRSFTYPFRADRIGKLWVMRDAPRSNSRDYRAEEWISYNVEPREAVRVARRHTRGRFFICAIRAADESDEEIRASFRRLKYRLMHTEPFMLHRLRQIPRFACDYPIERVRTQAVADRLAKAAGARQILPEHLNSRRPPMRQYVVLDGRRPIGWVRSIHVGNSGWVSNMHVEPKYRRRGIGRAMLSRMLRDDRATGMRRSMLLASHTGALLYPVVGYEMIGELLLFAPPKK
jgi:GNAT superfamily N-acetyltransferase